MTWAEGGGGGKRPSVPPAFSRLLRRLFPSIWRRLRKRGGEGGTEEADSFRGLTQAAAAAMIECRSLIQFDERAPFVPFQVHDPLLPPERRRLPRRLHQVALHDHAPVGGVPEGKVDAGGKIGVFK